MTQRLELGPMLVAVGALLLIVSLFLAWFAGGITAWNVFEVWDLVLAALALAALAMAVGMVAPETALLDRNLLPFVVGAVVVIVASQIINRPPAAAGLDRDLGCWLALGAAALQLAGVVLTLSRVSFAISVEGRDTRRRVSAVDARDPATTAESSPLFSSRTADAPPPEAPVPDEGSKSKPASRRAP